ncbi:MAG: glycosyltransferase family 2 protein [Candidatus Omnitrophota bacterium]|nr:glycosyltransferase family 2 protein [Candidatus Omnitrophota bacterium]
MRCDIIIPIWNQLEFTRDCIKHLICSTRFPFRLILIDNGSGEETRRYLEGLIDDISLDCQLIRNEKNLGFIKAVNQGLKASSAPYICIMNNDTIPAPGWLERMVEFAETRKDIGLVNPQCGGHGNIPLDVYARTLEKRRGRYMEMNQCQGFCMLLKKEVVDKIGLLDESFGIGGYDDTDYSMRAHLAGYRCVAIQDSYVYHRLHSSFNESGDREEWVKRNQKIYYDKWGRHLRVGLAVSMSKLDKEALRRVVQFTYGMARQWSWAHIWINSGNDRASIMNVIDEILVEERLPAHQNIRMNFFRMPGWLFAVTVAGKMLERMRKRMRDKKFDAVIAFGGMASSISSTAAIMKAMIFRVDLAEDIPDWEKKGKDIALLIKAKRVAV